MLAVTHIRHHDHAIESLITKRERTKKRKGITRTMPRRHGQRKKGSSKQQKAVAATPTMVEDTKVAEAVVGCWVDCAT